MPFCDPADFRQAVCLSSVLFAFFNGGLQSLFLCFKGLYLAVKLIDHMAEEVYSVHLLLLLWVHFGRGAQSLL